MEEELESFLRSREVPEEDINKLKMDKIDRSVLLVMTDEERAKYIRSYGDRLAVMSFCQQKDVSANRESTLERLRHKIGARRTGTKVAPKHLQSGLAATQLVGMARHNNTFAQKNVRRLEIGWLHFHKNDYYQVRTKSGGGTRHVTLDKHTTIAQIMETGKKLFFQNGVSPKGPEENFTFTVCDFKRNPVSMESTVLQLYEEFKLKMLRLYLCTQNKLHPSMDNRASSGSDDSIPGPISKSFPHRDVTEELLRLPRHKRQKTANDDHNQQNSAAEFEDVDYTIPGPSSSSTPNEGRSSVHHTTQGFQDDDALHSSSHAEEFLNVTGVMPSSSELQDTARDYEIHGFTILAQDKSHEIIVIQEDSEIYIGKGHSESVDLESTIEWNLEYNDQDLKQNKEPNEVFDVATAAGHDHLQPPSIRLVNAENFQHVQLNQITLNKEPNEVFDVATAAGHDHLQPPSIRLVNAENFQHVQHNLEVADPQDEAHTPPPREESPSPIQKQYALIRRVKVVDDLLEIFMDSNILEVSLKMELKNEMAVDDHGVSREVYTAFWTEFLEQCEGEEERVPRLRPDFSEAQWQAVGRIWAKGYMDHGIIPVRLSKAFILACILGIDAVDEEVLMSSFFNYLSAGERSSVEKALQGTMDDEDKEDLLDLFSRMGSHNLPCQGNTQVALETMAHKAILQEPKYVIDCFSHSLSKLQLNLSDKESVLSLYESKRPTNKRVAEMLQTSSVILSQKEQTTFNLLQRYIRNAEQRKLEMFLRFCTGSSAVCTEKIEVSFNAVTGLSRRPVAHTCGSVLEIPYTYSSYPEFRTEFDNVLSGDFFSMDIL